MSILNDFKILKFLKINFKMFIQVFSRSFRNVLKIFSYFLALAYHFYFQLRFCLFKLDKKSSNFYILVKIFIILFSIFCRHLSFSKKSDLNVSNLLKILFSKVFGGADQKFKIYFFNFTLISSHN